MNATTETLTSPDPGLRGTTTLADRVVEKVAARSAVEVPGCLGPTRTIIGIDTGHEGVRATAVTDGSITGLSLTIAIAYPQPITGTTRAVRARVLQRVQTLCGLTVDHIDIAVSALPRTTREQARVR